MMTRLTRARHHLAAHDDLTRKGTLSKPHQLHWCNKHQPRWAGTQVPIWNVPFRRNPFLTGREPIFRQLDSSCMLEDRRLVTTKQPLSGLVVRKAQTAVSMPIATAMPTSTSCGCRLLNSQKPPRWILFRRNCSIFQCDAQEQQIVVQAPAAGDAHWLKAADLRQC